MKGEDLPSQSEKYFVAQRALDGERSTNDDVDDRHTENRSQVGSVITRRRIQAIHDQKLEDVRSLTSGNGIQRDCGSENVWPSNKQCGAKRLTNETAQETNTRTLL